MADWSKLPCDVLGEIALKLDSLEDVIYFSVVCSSWQFAFSSIKKTWRASVPWLLLTENTKKNSKNTKKSASVSWLLLIENTEKSTNKNPKSVRKLFDLNKRRCYGKELPETFGAKCWGTSSGWIVTIDLTLELHVFNPFTGARILLPPQSTMPLDRELDEDKYWMRLAYVDRAYVFDLSRDDFVVVVLHGGPFDAQIAYARPGDGGWTPLTTSKKCVHDIIRLGSQLLVVFEDGVVGYCDIPFLKNSKHQKEVKEYLPTLAVELQEAPYRRFYLMEYFGNLLLICRYKVVSVWSSYSPSTWDTYRTKRFYVYLFDFDTKTWKIVEDLGDMVIFVGNSCTMGVDISATNYYSLKRNYIYFTDDEAALWEIPKLNGGGHDMGIYNLRTKKIKRVYKGDDIHSKYCPPIWFLPTFSS